MTTVWVAPSATSFSCLCEVCLEHARTTGLLFADALMVATVRGGIDADAEQVATRCTSGHEVVVRRNTRPPTLHPHDDRQLSIA
jgi:hypothetical protein